MNYYSVIKEQLINNEIYKKGKDYSKNRSDLETYYNVGKLLSEAGKSYGDGIIKEYSRKLSLELDKKYTVSLLYKIKQFYFIYEKVPTLSGKMTWSHWYELLPIKDINKVSYYVKICEEQNLGVRDLRKKIKSNEYERLDENTKSKLINKGEEKIEDFIKNPVLIRNSYNEEVTEKKLKRLIEFGRFR